MGKLVYGYNKVPHAAVCWLDSGERRFWEETP
jgi:hypothetical protein